MDVLARDRRLAVVKLAPGFEAAYAGKPAVHPVAGAGEIVSWERLATGRYNILVKGECASGSRRAASEHPLPDRQRPEARGRGATIDVSAALARIRDACGRCAGARSSADLLDTGAGRGQAPGVIADRIAAAVVPDPALRQGSCSRRSTSRARLERLGAALDQLVNELRQGAMTRGRSGSRARRSSSC